MEICKILRVGERTIDQFKINSRERSFEAGSNILVTTKSLINEGQSTNLIIFCIARICICW